ncbi:hypothetical protein [Alkalibacillus aidingensis]|uniref:hypothetical protein n=1 Tax=Alkalibacillus aidingensis TaxID=2747607 RepID=UPI001661670E|nr:hypothetical protein [Alkalibacillus aidingensis]
MAFDPNEWKLVTVEVRNDKGKFINSTWEKTIDMEKYCITIGYGDAVQTIIKIDSDGLGFEFVKDGPIYQFVSEVNQELMKEIKYV